MGKIIIVGGGWAGCAAAVRAAKAGMETVVIEKTDMLLGLGNVGGIMRNNGRFTAAEENICLGAGELFDITDRLSLHRNVDFPGHNHASLYDVMMVEPEVRRFLRSLGVQLSFMSRAVDVIFDEDGGTRTVKGVKLVRSDGGDYIDEVVEGDAFVETTGSAGPMGNCAGYGRGCSMCVLRCPAFGPRCSLTERAGIPDMTGERPDGKPGALSGSCKLEKRSLSPVLQDKLEKNGFVVVPLGSELINREKLSQKVCQQYALPEFAENIVLLDTGYAKLMSPFFELEKLRSIDGFENVRFADPYAGGKGNSLRYMAVGRCNRKMLAAGFSNLFMGGEKSGFFVGHTEAITTGSLAGYNAAVLTAELTDDKNTLKHEDADKNIELLELPVTLATGELIAFQQEQLKEKDCLRRRFTFAGGEFFRRMEEKDLYTTDKEEIAKRIAEAGLTDIYNR